MVSYGGMVNLLSLMSLYLASILPTNRLFFFGLSSIFLASILLEFGVKFAFVNYVSSSILIVILIYNKVIIIPYVLFFGYYAIIKYYIEKINNFFIEWIIKISLFNITMYLIYLIVDKLFIGDIKINLPFWIITILAQIVFIIYDYAFSVAIGYYVKNFRNKIL